jgi:exoribonuclease R
VIGTKNSSGGLQQLTLLLRNGKFFEVRSDNVAFCTKDFVSTHQTIDSPVKLEDIDSNGLLQNIPPTYARAVQHYQRTLSMTKGMAHQGLAQLYRQFVNDDTETQISLNTLASRAFKTQSPSPLQRHVTFLHLVSDNIRFVPTRDVRGSDIWTLRSQKKCQKITDIIESIRTRDASYTGFLTRMKALIVFYNNHADPVLGTFSQTALEMAPQVTSTLTDSDKVFVNFIADWIRSPKVIVDSPYEVFVPNLLKALRCYNDLFFDRSLAIRFLKEVGMFKPWDNIGLVEDAAVAGEFIWSKEAQQNERKMSEFTTAFLTGGKNSRELNTDKYESIRHDFGDLAVYTIDDPSAKEIDDGISIEHVPGDNSAWLHVHIADPTTYISPTHELAQLMQQKVQTLYLPERHFPMLPEELSSKKFSLGSTAHTNSNGSQYALTFSTRIDKNGDLVDYKIRPSFVKNVIKVYYDDLDQLLKPLVNTPIDPLVDLTKTFCHPSSESFALKDQQKATRASTVPEHAKADLLNIHQMASKHAAKRIANGAILFSRPSPVLEILPEPLDLPDIQFSTPNYVSHLPAVRVKLDHSSYSPARQMVAETMIMGGRVASKFAQENNVSIPFRTQQWNPRSSTTDLRLRDEMIKSRDPATGMIKMQDMVNYMSILPPSTLTTDPGLPHVVMGIQDGYTRATSPLRRYLDVVVHWQLKSHLLGEKQTPFSKDQLSHLASRVMTREKQLSLLQQRSIQFWVISLLDRMRVDGFTDDMEWNCIVNIPSRIATTELGGTMDVATGTLLELGVRGRIEKLNRSVEVGEVVKVRVSSLEPLLGRINLELI